MDEGKLLPVMEEFYSIQGEGHHTGKPAYFIRIGGCDVGCSWCDTKESWDASIHPLVGVDDIVDRAMACNARSVVLTGGEPLMFNVSLLTARLKEHGIIIYLETSGAYPTIGDFDWICLSPKKNNPPEDSIIGLADELKVIIEREDDLNWAEHYAGRVGKDCKLYLQPEWSKHTEMTALIVNYILRNPEWRISIQSHKFMNIP